MVPQFLFEHEFDDHYADPSTKTQQREAPSPNRVMPGPVPPVNHAHVNVVRPPAAAAITKRDHNTDENRGTALHARSVRDVLQRNAGTTAREKAGARELNFHAVPLEVVLCRGNGAAALPAAALSAAALRHAMAALNHYVCRRCSLTLEAGTTRRRDDNRRADQGHRHGCCSSFVALLVVLPLLEVPSRAALFRLSLSHRLLHPRFCLK
mmetsp:Transcript_4314/g.10531  ORF Transcript_4314/g.10531 Transcript_4314/m.10531 type:complete len:209 (-) Transcript_4314:322-948(-)